MAPSSKYINRDSATGLLAEVQPISVSAGAGDASKLFQLDANGLIDPSFMPSGIVADSVTANANGAITAKDLCYMEAAGTIARATAAVSGFATIGFAQTTVSTGNPVVMQLEGKITGLTGLTVGARYYLSSTTPGGLVATPVTGTGKLHQFVGTAVSTTVLNFEPDDAIVLA